MKLNQLQKMDPTVLGHLHSQVTNNSSYRCFGPKKAWEHLSQCNRRELLDIYLNEIGIIGYTQQILTAIDEIDRVTP